MAFLSSCRLKFPHLERNLATIELTLTHGTDGDTLPMEVDFVAKILILKGKVLLSLTGWNKAEGVSKQKGAATPRADQGEVPGASLRGVPALSPCAIAHCPTQ